MSGGHFDYSQYQLERIAGDIQNVVDGNHSEELTEYDNRRGYQYPDEIIARFQQTAIELKRLCQVVNKIDYLLSGDSGEESFLAQTNQFFKDPS